MILYLDTSAYIKLFVAESGSDLVREAVDQADILTTNILAYAEMRAAFTSILRTRRLGRRDMSLVKRRFERHWQRVLRFTADETAIRQAGNFAERFGLRGYDSIHLVSALLLKKQAALPFKFACFDMQLNRAATSLRLQTIARLA